MKKTLFAVFAAMLVLGTSSAAWANGPYNASLPVIGGYKTPKMTHTPANGVPDIYMAINVLLGSSYTSNADVNFMQYTGATSEWQNVGDPSHGGAAFIGISAGNINSLRVYDTATPATKLNVFPTGFTGFGLAGDGTALNPFPSSPVPLATGTNFGWNLKSTGSSTKIWDSNTLFNSDKIDHMFVYRLSALAGKTVYLQNPTTLAIEKYTYQDPYFLAWEDLSLASNGLFSDQDYNDIMYVVDRVVPVPEPSTVALFSFGLVGLGAFTLRRKLMMA